MNALIQDLRYGARVLLKQRGFTFVAILTLALGIGANTAIFSAVEAILLRPLPYKEANGIVYLTSSFPGNDRGGDNFSYPDFVDLKSQAGSFDAVAAYQDWIAVTLTGEAEPVRLTANFVSESYFDVFGAVAGIGRTFSPEESRIPGAAHVAVLSHTFWQRQFGGDAEVVGRKVFINHTPITVVGVMNEDFRDLEETWRPQIDLWMPLGLSDQLLGQRVLENRGGRVFNGVARLKEGVLVEQAQAEISSVAGRLAEVYPDTNRGYDLHVRSLRDYFLGNLYNPILLLLAGSMFFLLIACANVANLLLARATARRREFTVRAALGASRTRLALQSLSEHALLAVAGGALGLLLAQWLVEMLGSWSAIDLPGFVKIEINGWVLAASALLTIVTGLLFGMAPALESSRVDLREGLSQAGRQSGGLSRGLTRSALTVAEVSLSLVLLAGAGLTMKSFQKLTNTGLGYDTSNLLTMRMDLRSERYREPAARARFGRELAEKAGAIPGIESAIIWGPSNLGHATWVMFIAPEGQPVRGQEDLLMTHRHSVNEGGLSSLGIRLLRGRDITWHDTAETPRVAVISEDLAERLWPGDEPLGKRFWWQALNNYVTVVGVASDAFHRTRFDLRYGARVFDPQLDVYVPYSQSPNAGLVLALRTSSDPDSVISSVRQTVLAIDRDLPVYDVNTLDERLRDEEGPSRAIATLMTVYAALALMLASLGVYGVLSYAVGQRKQEFGIRMALGAERRHILGLVIRRGLALVLTGVAIGLAASFVLARLLSSLLFDVSVNDPLTFAVAPLALTLVALAACYIPARRATKVDPMAALRYE